jgi:hypothetical protein
VLFVDDWRHFEGVLQFQWLVRHCKAIQSALKLVLGAMKRAYQSVTHPALMVNAASLALIGCLGTYCTSSNR